jgi:hypothetical protein
MKNVKIVRKKECSVYVNIILAISLCVCPVLIGGCQTRTQTGTLAGTGVGALIGQAVGGDTKATMIGAAIGAGAGYLIGNSQDKKAAKTHDMSQPTPLTGTSWKVISLVKKDMPPYESIIVEFKPNGEIVTTRHEPGGTMTVTEERYRIVGNTLIINKPGYIINAIYQVKGNQLTINCEQFRAVLERVK